MGKVYLVLVFFISTPLVILSSLYSLYTLTLSKEGKVITHFDSQVLGYSTVLSSLPQENKIESEIPQLSISDARIHLIEDYLKEYNSPLAPFAKFIVEIADKYGVDYRLLTAIAQQESNLCKVIPENSYNCWGWGIHSKGTLKFTSYFEAIETVTKGLKTKYLDKGYNTPEEIMQKYTPQSNGSWAFGVSQFMDEIKY